MASTPSNRNTRSGDPCTCVRTTSQPCDRARSRASTNVCTAEQSMKVTASRSIRMRRTPERQRSSTSIGLSERSSQCRSHQESVISVLVAPGASRRPSTAPARVRAPRGATSRTSRHQTTAISVRLPAGSSTAQPKSRTSWSHRVNQLLRLPETSVHRGHALSPLSRVRKEDGECPASACLASMRQSALPLSACRRLASPHWPWAARLRLKPPRTEAERNEVRVDGPRSCQALHR